MDVHKRTGKAPVNKFIQVKDSRVKLHIVYTLWIVSGNLIDGAKDPSRNQEHPGPLLDLTKRQMGNSLHVKVTG